MCSVRCCGCRGEVPVVQSKWSGALNVILFVLFYIRKPATRVMKSVLVTKFT